MQCLVTRYSWMWDGAMMHPGCRPVWDVHPGCRPESTGPGQCHLLTGDKRPELRARLIARETLRCNFALRPVMRRGLMRPPRVINWRNTNTFVGSIWLLANANRIAPARVEEARPPPSPRACLAPLGRLARSVSRCKGAAGPRNAMREDNRWHRV